MTVAGTGSDREGRCIAGERKLVDLGHVNQLNNLTWELSGLLEFRLLQCKQLGKKADRKIEFF